MEQLDDKLTDLEREEWNKLFRHKWYQDLSDRLKAIVKKYPPFYLYKLRSSGHLVVIKSYEEDKNNERADLVFLVTMRPKDNPQHIFEQEIWGVPEHDLERVKLRKINQLEKILSDVRDLPQMNRLINTRDREDVKRGNKPRTH